MVLLDHFLEGVSVDALSLVVAEYDLLRLRLLSRDIVNHLMIVVLSTKFLLCSKLINTIVVYVELFIAETLILCHILIL